MGASGTFDFSVPLKKGRNEIVVESTDGAGQTQEVSVIVVRKDGKPVVKLDAPKKIARNSLPKKVKLSVVVSDVGGQKMADAAVTFIMQGTGRPAETFESETNANGRASWSVEIKGDNQNPIDLVVEVTSPYGQPKTVKQQIQLD